MTRQSKSSRRRQRRSQKKSGAPVRGQARQTAKATTGVMPRVKELAGRRWVLLAVIGICAVAAFLRLAHLLDGSHYYILSPDSHFFHWRAEQYVQGERFALRGTGLVLPLAYVGKCLSLVFRLSIPEALNVTGKLLPPFIGVVTMLTMYWAVRRIYDRDVALLSALTWACLPLAIYFGAAGYLDRDGLSVALIMVGALAFYLCRDWRLSIRGREVGWLAAGIAVLFVEFVLFLEWNYAGPAILLGILFAYVVARLIASLIRSVVKKRKANARSAGEETSLSLNRSEWRTCALIAVPNGLVAAVYHQKLLSYADTVLSRMGYLGESRISEMRGLTPGDVLQFGAFLIPLAIGLYMVLTKWSPRNLLFLSWFGCCAFASLFATRLLPFALPAICVIVGLALAGAISRARVPSLFRVVKCAGLIILALLLIVTSVRSALNAAAPRLVAADRDWQQALSFLRERTAPGSRVMTWWDYGYWILDLGERTPVMDNGYYGHPEYLEKDTAVAYCTSDPAEALVIMGRYDADYLVFSDLDLPIASLIVDRAGLGWSSFLPANSLASRCLQNSFQSEGGLQVAYQNAGVCILARSS